jgi:hypothetical protein
MLSRILATAAVGTALMSGLFLGGAHALDLRRTKCKSLTTPEVVTIYIDKQSNVARVETYNASTGVSQGMPGEYIYKPGAGVLVMTKDKNGFFSVRDDGKVGKIAFALTGSEYPVVCTQFQRF